MELERQRRINEIRQRNCEEQVRDRDKGNPEERITANCEHNSHQGNNEADLRKDPDRAQFADNMHANGEQDQAWTPKDDNHELKIDVVIDDAKACPRYAGITVTNVKVKESPAWLQNKLKAVGLRPINNIVDITNYILFETGQPLHAFDADKITGKKIIVKKLAAGTKFTTLDEVERELLPTDLMICNPSEGMCIAGVFGGTKSGVTENTHNVFIESAYFDTVHVRKTSKHHGLKTDASFRFERGVDPNMVIFALKHAALLMKEIAGGSISSDIVDVYPEPIKNFSVDINYANVDKLIGKVIDRNTIKKILASLEIEIVSETTEGLALSVPPFKVDVLREADVVEEILRIYGYNNVEEPQQFRISPSKAPDPTKKRYKTPLLITLAVAGSTRS